MPLWQRLKSWLWPHIGWGRALSYVVKRLKRLPGTPHSIAAGVAAGVMVSFTPFFPHLATAALIAMVIRGNVVAAWAGTLIGNPSTFPIIWLLAYNLGLMVLGQPTVTEPQFQAESQLTTLPAPFTLEWVDGWIERAAAWTKAKFLPMAIGGVPLGILAGLACYFPLLRIVTAVQERRRKDGQKKLELDPSAPPGMNAS
ncbi:MAG: DUF2062 domain-containing protein [Geminicoccaceae bacterium]|nr:DUF2062 domain-containing protein [Geminicoccaceae bacterium]